MSVGRCFLKINALWFVIYRFSGFPTTTPFVYHVGWISQLRGVRNWYGLFSWYPHTHKRNAHALNQIKLSGSSKGQILIYRKQLGQAEFRCAYVSPESRGRVLITDSIFLIIACLFRNDSPQCSGGMGIDGQWITRWPLYTCMVIRGEKQFVLFQLKPELNWLTP